MRITRFSFLHLFVFLSAYLFILAPVEAAYLKFDKATTSVTAGSTFTLNAVVDAGIDQITSTDMWILYDPTLIEAQSASSGAFFPAVTNNLSSGKTYIAGLITTPGTYMTGVGTVATITFRALKNGTATVAYDCRTDASNSSKVIKNAVDPINIIVCSQNGTSVVTVGTGGTVAPTTGAQPTTVYGNQTQPTTLPQTGIMDELPKLLMVGIMFVMVGTVMRLFL